MRLTAIRVRTDDEINPTKLYAIADTEYEWNYVYETAINEYGIENVFSTNVTAQERAECLQLED